jgi:SRSO17 transposase
MLRNNCQIAIAGEGEKDNPPRVTGVKEDYSRRIVTMTLQQIAGLGKKLAAFLPLFNDCFGRREGRELLAVYVKGQLSNVHRKTAEAIALCFGRAPRTLQRFLESIKWDEQRLRDRCQQIVASQHAHPQAVGLIDESAVSKSGPHSGNGAVGTAR